MSSIPPEETPSDPVIAKTGDAKADDALAYLSTGARPPSRAQPGPQQADGKEKFRWILRTAWKGLCPRCGKASMFQSFLKLRNTCPSCGLNYRFASPDDGPAFFSLCIVAFPLMFFVVWLEVVHEPPFWVHLLTSFPLMLIGCILPLQPIKAWLVASQYVHRAQEAGTEHLWEKLHGQDNDPKA